MGNNTDNDKKCFKCKIDFDGDKIIGCDGSCKNWFHLKCAGIKDKDFSVIDVCKGVKWFCEKCEAELVVSLNDVKFLIDSAIKSYANELECLKKLLMSHIGKNADNKIEGPVRPSYVEAVNKPAVIIKPKVDQQSTKTRKELEQQIKPSTLALGVSSVKNVRNGGIVINCQKEEDVTKLKNVVSEKLGRRYDVTLSKMSKPLIKIVGMAEKLTEDQIVDYIRAQNKEIISETSEISIKKVWERINRSTAIAEVDGGTFSRIMVEGKLNIGWTRCVVYEEFNIRRCFKCLGFNHKAENCQNTVSCSKCAGAHRFTDCKSEVERCINCIEVSKKLKLHLDPNHTAFDKQCPVLLRKIELERNKTKYI